MRVLICPDKFKGTLTAGAAAEAVAAGWRQARPADELELFPISDGGDGFGELLGRHWGAHEESVDTVDAAHQPLRAPWWWAPKRRIALIESARVIGLAMLPPGQFHPFDLDTLGLAAVIRAAAARHPRTLLIGIGGSATNDAGFGLARGLGWEFQDAKGCPLTRWTDLPRLTHLERPQRPLRFKEIVVAVDVRNPLLGMRGATQIYGPQKGIAPGDVRPAEHALRRLVRVMASRSYWARGIHNQPGAGAAGGLGYGLSVFLRARIEPGFDLFRRSSGLAERIVASDLVITGEGTIDLPTLSMGKGVGRVGTLCRRKHRPCIALAGQLQTHRHTTPCFAAVHALVPGLASVAEALAEPARWLTQLARQTAEQHAPPQTT